MGGLAPVQEAPQALISVCPLVARLLIPDPLQSRQGPCKLKYMPVRGLLQGELCEPCNNFFERP